MKKWCFCCVALAMSSTPVVAQEIPGSTDPGRIEPLKDRISPPTTISPVQPRPTITPFPSISIPEDAKYMTVLLSELRFDGMTAFKKEDMADMYAEHLGKRITLDKVWHMAEEVTRRYREKGYFLSRAYVPSQEVSKGIVTIRVVEGYIGEVSLNDPAIDTAIIRAFSRQIMAQRPLNVTALENQLLLLNDLPGYRFRSVLEPKEGGKEGEIRLVIVPEKKGGRSHLSLDNYNSRYLGPHQFSAFHQASLLPMQQTSIAVLANVPFDKLGYISLRHEIPVYPAVTLGVQGNYVLAKPGYVLEENDIESTSSELAFDLRYAAIRQRDRTLMLSSGIRAKSTDTDIADLPLTRDRIRAIWLGADYNTFDASQAYHYVNAKLTQGIGAFGASKEGSATLSRAEADPDFTKMEIYYQYQRQLGSAFMAIGQATGQYSFSPLFSAEEFGYGGQRFGRGYDPSEITGDHGIALALEMRYLDVPEWNQMKFSPFVFYDFGAVWNEDSGEGGRISAASAGLGLVGELPKGVESMLTIAKPLTYQAGTPLYGSRGEDTRFLFSLSLDF